ALRVEGVVMPEWPDRISEEARQHLDDEYAALRAGGASHEDAIRALATDVAMLARPSRFGAAAGLGADLRYSIRALRKSLSFSALVIATLALGIGANTAIFSVLNAVVLRPLPYDRDGRLVVVWGNLHKPGLEEIPASADEFVDYREANRVFDVMSAYDTIAVNVTGGSQPERVSGAVTTASLFGMLGAAPAVGRALLATDEQPGRDRVVVLSHGWWQRRFGADPAVIGRAITLDGK